MCKRRNNNFTRIHRLATKSLVKMVFVYNRKEQKCTSTHFLFSNSASYTLPPPPPHQARSVTTMRSSANYFGWFGFYRFFLWFHMRCIWVPFVCLLHGEVVNFVHILTAFGFQLLKIHSPAKYSFITSIFQHKVLPKPFRMEKIFVNCMEMRFYRWIRCVIPNDKCTIIAYRTLLYCLL